MVSHTMITLALLPIPTHPPDYTLARTLSHKSHFFVNIVPPYLLILPTAVHPVLLSHVLLLLLPN